MGLVVTMIVGGIVVWSLIAASAAQKNGTTWWQEMKGILIGMALACLIVGIFAANK